MERRVGVGEWRVRGQESVVRSQGSGVRSWSEELELESGGEFLATKNRRCRRCQELEFRVGVGERRWRQKRRSEAGEPTGAREHVCGPGVILTASVIRRA